MRIMLLSEQKESHLFVKHILEQSRFVVDKVMDQSSGIYKAMSGVYDIIIQDEDFARVEMLSKIRRRHKGLYIMLLNFQRTEMIDQILRLGIDYYFIKPFCADNLLAVIQRYVLTPREFQSDMMLRVSDIEMDIYSFSVKKEGKKIPLTRKEFALLECFLQYPGQVLSRSFLLQKVWSDATNLFTNSIDVHMSALRRKLERTNSAVSIETIYGIGYRLNGDATS